MIELGRLTIKWLGWRYWRRPFFHVDRFGTKQTSELVRVLIGPIRVDWWTVLP